MTVSNDLSTAIATKVIHFQALLRQHATPWSVFERLHASSGLLFVLRLLLYAFGICCVLSFFAPRISTFVFRWGWRLFLSYPIVVLIHLGWWNRFLRVAKTLPCRVAKGCHIRLPGFVLFPVEDLNGKHHGRLLIPRKIFLSYGFAQLRPADQLTALQTRFLFWRLLLPTELVFDSLQPELTNLTQQWEEN